MVVQGNEPVKSPVPPRVEAGWIEIAPGCWVRASAVVAFESRSVVDPAWWDCASVVHTAVWQRDAGFCSPHEVDVLRLALSRAEAWERQLVLGVQGGWAP